MKRLTARRCSWLQGSTVLLAVALLGAGETGCFLGYKQASSASSAIGDTGIKTNALGLRREVVIELPGGLMRSVRVFEMRDLPGGSVLLTTSVGLFWYGKDGKKHREARFSTGKHHDPVATAELGGPSALSALGVLNGKKVLAFYDDQGRLYNKIPCYRYAQFVLANLVGDDTREVVLEEPAGKGLTVYSAAGDRLFGIDPVGYLTDFDAVDADGDGRDELILYSYPNARRGGTFQVVRADGTQLHRWDDRALADFALVRWQGVWPRILWLADDAFVFVSLEGRQVDRLEVPYGAHFRYVYKADLKGKTVLLASGGGYVYYHMVCVYGRGGLEFHAVERGWAHSLLVPDPGKVEFWVGTDDSVIRYAPGAAGL